MWHVRKQALAAVLLLASTGTSCLPRDDQMERDIREIRKQVADLRRARSDENAHTQEIQARIFLLEDRLDTARLAMQRANRVPELPIVSMAPGGPPLDVSWRGLPGAPQADAEVPIIRAVGTGRATRTVPKATRGPKARGTGRAKTLPRARLAAADRKGLDAGEPVAIEDVPPRPTPARAARRKGAAKPPRAAKAKAKAAAAAAAPSKDPVERYQKAYQTMKSGDIDTAKADFRTFVEAFPQHQYADNAQYWVGECDYTSRDYRGAIGEFRRVIEIYPAGNKVPDALLKIGLSYLNLGDADTAKEVLGQVVEIFPNSPAANVARDRVRRL
jgi:tol-pal system protein YbgF